LVDFMGGAIPTPSFMPRRRPLPPGSRRLGIGKGDRVGLYLPNVPIYMSAYYGASMAGATLVNFSPLYTAHELAAQVADSGTRLLVTLDSSALLPTALEVLRTSHSKRWWSARSARCCRCSRGGPARCWAARRSVRIPQAGNVLRWDAVLAEAAARPCRIDP
jgi:long-chain acyl-CoA synthetase